MKAYRIKTYVSRNDSGSYRVSSSEANGSFRLCSRMYESIIGEEVTGSVTFILRKIKGRARDYVYPFRIKYGSLEVREPCGWTYAKDLFLLAYGLDTEKLEEWAGKSMFSIEMEW